MKTPIKLAVFDMAGTTINNNAVVPQLLLKAFLSNGFDQLNLDLVDEKRDMRFLKQFAKYSQLTLPTIKPYLKQWLKRFMKPSSKK